MNNRKLIIIFVLILLLSGGGLFFMLNNTSSNKVEDIYGTAISLINSGRSLTCTVTDKIQNSTVTGTWYVANGKARLDYQSTSNILKMTGHIITDSQYGYLWSEQAPNQGIKIALAPILTPAVTNNQTLINKPIHFSCLPWSASDSSFILPTNMKFQTIKLQ